VEPPLGLAFAAPIQCPLESSRSVDGVQVASAGIHQRLPPSGTSDQACFPPPWLCCTRHRRDYGAASIPVALSFLEPAYRAGRLQDTGSGAQGSRCWAGDGSLLFPRWLVHHSTPLAPPGRRGCTPSSSPLPWPSLNRQARLPVGPLRVVIYDAAGFAFMLRTGGCTLRWSPTEGDPRFDAQISPDAGGLYKGACPSFDRTRTG